MKWVQACFCVVLTSLAVICFAQTQTPQMPTLIRDTDVAEGKEDNESPPAKEFNPLLAEQNINIGNFYLKKKNYTAAIQRYLTALEYHPDSIPAHEALARAYEKSGDIAKAIVGHWACHRHWTSRERRSGGC